MWRQALGEFQSLARNEVLDPIHASGLLAPIVLRHLSDGKAFSRPGPHQKPLKMMDGRDVATMGGSVDPLLELEDLPLEGFPRQVLPFIR